MSERVLDNIRVLDLTAWQAGPTVTMILADFGAEVLKIEAPKRLDGWRGGAGLMEGKAYERGANWNAVNRNKLGISLDLKSEAGRDLFLQLVEQADVVVENFTPRVMENFGLDYEVLRERNKGIVMIALSGFGATGPWRDYSAFAFPTEEVSGLAYLNGDRGGPPILVGQPVTDALAGAMGAFAILAALQKRERTGEGDYIDLSQIETLSNGIAAELVDAQLNGRDAERRGNEREGMEPHGVYRCPMDDTWIAIAVRTDSDWRALCGLMSRPDLADDPALKSLDGRRSAHDIVNGAVSDWVATRNGFEAEAELQQAGIAASICMRPSHLMQEDQLWSRGFFQMLHREELGTHPYPGAVVRLTKTPATFERPAPLFGQHTRQVLRERLGLGDEELDALEAAGVTSTEPANQDWR